MCAGGACEQTVDCRLGACQDASPIRASTLARHNTNQASFDLREAAACPFSPSELPTFEALVDDSEIPEFDRGRSRRTNFAAGREFLQDWELHEHLQGVQGAFFECLDLAACYEEQPASTGELDFQFELEPTGRVSAVSVAPSPELDQPIVRACARRSLYQARFPSWNGARMVVDYSLRISVGQDV